MSNAEKIYTQRYEEVKVKLAELAALVEAHNAQCFKHWGHVGDLTHVASELEIVREFLAGDGMEQVQS